MQGNISKTQRPNDPHLTRGDRRPLNERDRATGSRASSGGGVTVQSLSDAAPIMRVWRKEAPNPAVSTRLYWATAHALQYPTHRDWRERRPSTLGGRRGSLVRHEPAQCIP